MRLFHYFPSKDETDAELDKKIFKYSMVIPGLFLLCFWLVFLVEIIIELDFSRFGIHPLHTEGLIGIVLSPFIHSGFSHLAANSIPFFVLSVALFYFYRKLAYPIFFLIYFLSGICVWLAGREAWHIGASGIIYGLSAFLLFSGIFRNDVKLLTVSIIVVFLYGGMFWGIFPIEPSISWESHLWGAVSGILLSVYFRNRGPKRTYYEWEYEPDTDDIDEIGNDIDATDLNKNDTDPEKT